MSTEFHCVDDPPAASPGDCVTWEAVEVQPAFTDLDVAGAQSLAVAILGVWAVAWAFRVLARFVRDS